MQEYNSIWEEIATELSVIPIEIWYLIFIIAIIQISLQIYCLYDWFKAENKDMTNRKVWFLMILFVNFGTIVYLWIAPRESGNRLEFDDDELLEEAEVFEYKG